VDRLEKASLARADKPGVNRFIIVDDGDEGDEDE